MVTPLTGESSKDGFKFLFHAQFHLVAVGGPDKQNAKGHGGLWWRRQAVPIGFFSPHIRTSIGVGAGVMAGIETGIGTGVMAGILAGIETGIGAGIMAGVGTGIETGIETGIGIRTVTGIDLRTSCRTHTLVKLTPTGLASFASI